MAVKLPGMRRRKGVRPSALGAIGLLAVGALLFHFTPSGTQAAGTLPQEPLPALSGPSVSLAACPTEKCLTVYVAPWCGYCRSSTPKLLELRTALKARQVASRIVVGMDQQDRVLEYARAFGPDTLLDGPGDFVVKGGVPHFYVSDRSGRVLREMAGVPQGGISDVDGFAAQLGLP